MLTREVHAALEGSREFRPNAHVQVVLVLQALLPGLDSCLDHPLEVSLVERVQDVAEPLAVHVVPVPLVREVAHDGRLPPGELEHVLHGEALNLGHRSDEDLVPPDIL